MIDTRKMIIPISVVASAGVIISFLKRFHVAMNILRNTKRLKIMRGRLWTMVMFRLSKIEKR